MREDVNGCLNKVSHLSSHPSIVKSIARIVVVLVSVQSKEDIVRGRVDWTDVPAAHDDSESSLVPRGVAVNAAHHRLVDANSCQLALVHSMHLTVSLDGRMVVWLNDN